MRTLSMMTGLALVRLCFATTLVSPDQTRALYEASNAAESGAARAAALEAIEAVAEGKPTEVILDAAKRAGIEAFFAKSPFRIDDGFSRCYAFEMIGRTGLPEAVEYLSRVTPEMIAHDTGDRRLYGAAKLALQKALLREEADPGRQVAFLERQLTEPVVPEAHRWAVGELCDRGANGSMDKIEQVFRRWYSGSRAEGGIRFCKERMDVVNRDPDRAKAIGSVLQVEAGIGQKEIIGWAVNQLVAMEAAEADEVLDHYSAAVAQKFPYTEGVALTPDSSMHRSFAELIDHSRPDRAKRAK